ncbi:unnamed protein product, partial [Rotaria sordida]
IVSSGINISNAIRLGYPLINTAELYRNESEIGEAVKKKPIDRKQIFISTKLFRLDDDCQDLRRSFNHSLQKLNTNYIDLYLFHVPQVGYVIEVYDGAHDVFVTTANGKIATLKNQLIENTGKLS